MMIEKMFTGTEVFLLIEAFMLNPKSFRKKVLEERLSTNRFEKWLRQRVSWMKFYDKLDFKLEEVIPVANEQKKIIGQLVKEGIYPDAATAGKAIKRYLQLAVKFMDAVDFSELWYEINTEK